MENTKTQIKKIIFAVLLFVVVQKSTLFLKLILMKSPTVWFTNETQFEVFL